VAITLILLCPLSSVTAGATTINTDYKSVELNPTKWDWKNVTQSTFQRIISWLQENLVNKIVEGINNFINSAFSSFTDYISDNIIGYWEGDQIGDDPDTEDEEQFQPLDGSVNYDDEWKGIVGAIRWVGWRISFFTENMGVSWAAPILLTALVGVLIIAVYGILFFLDAIPVIG